MPDDDNNLTKRKPNDIDLAEKVIEDVGHGAPVLPDSLDITNCDIQFTQHMKRGDTTAVDRLSVKRLADLSGLDSEKFKRQVVDIRLPKHGNDAKVEETNNEKVMQKDKNRNKNVKCPQCGCEFEA